MRVEAGVLGRLRRGARELGAASRACEIGEGRAARERDPEAWLKRGTRGREGRGTGWVRSRTGSGGEGEKRGRKRLCLSNAISAVSMAFGARVDSVSFLRNDFLLFLHLIDCHVIKLLMRC